MYERSWMIGIPGTFRGFAGSIAGLSNSEVAARLWASLALGRARAVGPLARSCIDTILQAFGALVDRYGDSPRKTVGVLVVQSAGPFYCPTTGQVKTLITPWSVERGYRANSGSCRVTRFSCAPPQASGTISSLSVIATAPYASFMSKVPSGAKAYPNASAGSSNFGS